VDHDLGDALIRREVKWPVGHLAPRDRDQIDVGDRPQVSAIPDFANLVQWAVRAAIAWALLAAPACPGSEPADRDGDSPGAVTTSLSLDDPDGDRLVDRECDSDPSLPPVECWWLDAGRDVGISPLSIPDPEVPLRMTTR
jgi:hypothetical protein